MYRAQRRDLVSASRAAKLRHGIIMLQHSMQADVKGPMVFIPRAVVYLPVKCMQGPGRRPAWHDSYTIDGVPLEQPLILTLTAYDVYDNGNKQLGACHPSGTFPIAVQLTLWPAFQAGRQFTVTCIIIFTLT